MSIELLRHIKQVDIRAELFRRRHFDFVTKSEVGYHEKQELALTYLTNKETKIIVYGGAAGGSKQQPLDTLLLTPDGYIPLRDIKVGQHLLNPDGSIQVVTHLHPIQRSTQYVFKLSNGEEVVSHAGHLWYGGWRRDKSDYLASWDNPNCIKTSKEIYEHVLRQKEKEARKRRNFRIPLPQKVEFKQRGQMKIDPYFLGAMIGNGTITAKSELKLTVYFEDLHHFVDIFKKLNIDCRTYIQKSKTCYDIVVKPRDRDNLKSIFSEYGLLNCKAKTKFIPEEYKITSRENRLNLLRGLLDTDGTFEKATGRVSYYTSSMTLAQDVAWIARSLGYFSTVVHREGREHNYCSEDRIIKGSDCYVVYIRSTNNKNLFKVERKTRGVNDNTKDYMSVAVLDVEIKEPIEMRCITVSNPNGLYIVDNFIVTHNSWTGGSWLMFMSYLYPGSRWFVGRNELKRLRQSTLPTIYKLSHRYGLRKEIDFRFHGQDNYINFKNGSRIDLLDLRYLPGDPLYERFGSIEYTGGWIEEAGEVDFNAFDVLKSRIGRHLNDEYDIKSKLFITLNPKKNWCYTRFYLPHSKAILPKNEVFIKCLVDENPFIESGYIEGLDEIEDKQLRERLRHGNWEYDDDSDALVSYDALCDLFTNNHIRPNTEERYITADIALEGSDYLEIGVWFGDVLVDHIRVPKSDGKKVYLLIDQIKVKYRVPNSQIIYDADGIGGFIAGFVKGAVAFHNGSAPLNGEKYDNIKSQLYYYLAKQIEDRKIWYAVKTEHDEEERIKTQLSAQLRRATADDDNKLRIKKKSEVKKDLGVSPDTADMFMMRMYFKINKKPKKAPRTVRVLS